MAKALIQTKDTFEGQKIKHLVEDMYIKSIVSFGRQSTFNAMVHERPDIFIYDAGVITAMTVDYVNEVYSRGFEKPTVILVDKASPQIKEFDGHEMVHILEKQLIQSMLGTLCVRLVENPNMKTQSYRRYSTYQQLKIESLLDGQGMTSYMTNLSLGGAFCVCDDEPSFVMGDLVLLKVSLGDLNKHHNMHAKVVWKKKDLATGQIGVGLQFISEQDMYKQLLEQI